MAVIKLETIEAYFNLGNTKVLINNLMQLVSLKQLYFAAWTQNRCQWNNTVYMRWYYFIEMYYKKFNTYYSDIPNFNITTRNDEIQTKCWIF